MNFRLDVTGAYYGIGQATIFSS